MHVWKKSVHNKMNLNLHTQKLLSSGLLIDNSVVHINLSHFYFLKDSVIVFLRFIL